MKPARYIHILQYVFLATFLPVASSRTLVQRSESFDQWEESFQDMLADFGDGQVQLTDAEWNHLIELEQADIDNQPKPMELDAPDPVTLETPTATQVETFTTTQVEASTTTTQVETSTAPESVSTLAPTNQLPLVYGSRSFQEENPIRLKLRMPREDVDAIFVTSTYGVWFLIYGTEYGQDVTRLGEEEIKHTWQQQKMDNPDSNPIKMVLSSTQVYELYILPALQDDSTGFKAFIRKMKEVNREKAGTAEIIGVVSVAKAYQSSRTSQSQAAENHKLINAIKASMKITARNQKTPAVPVRVPSQDKQIQYFNRDDGSEIGLVLSSDGTGFDGELSFGRELRKIQVDGGDVEC